MLDLFKSKFGLNPHIDWAKDKEAYYFRFTVEETAEFSDLIRPYVIPSMMYKLGLISASGV
jgi:hypothetical protein